MPREPIKPGPYGLGITHNAGEPAKEFIMAELALCFREKHEYRNPTKDEINSITRAAQGATAIIRVMEEYANAFPEGEEDDTLGIYGCVFHVLNLLMDPVTDYLFNFGGKEPEPEKETKRETA